jgi:uncharacterized protein YkwD
MAKPLGLLLAFLLSSGAPTVQPAARLMASSTGGGESPSQSQRVTVQPVAEHPSSDFPFNDDESKIEQQLLELANQSRQQAGAPPLTLDIGLTKAALAHARIMLEERQLSHQFEGEPALLQRLAGATQLQLDQTGENVALDYDAEHGHEHLMLSPPHRANLLNSAYNVVGMGVIRSGDRLYIVQDFGHALPSYTPAEAKENIASALNRVRREAKLPELSRRDLPDADALACSMGQADKLGTLPVQQLAARFTVLSYTSLRPETLPAGTDKAITSRNLRSFSVGACYSRTDTYPTGVYWIILSLD